MKNSKKIIANKRIETLFNNALYNARSNPNLSQQQARIAKKISLKFKIPLPYEVRFNFCKKCKKFIVPNVSSRVRLSSSNIKSVNITCNYCRNTYRKLI